MKSLTTLRMERGHFDAAPARNRFTRLSGKRAEDALEVQANIAVDCCESSFPCDRMRAAVFAEAAAHWAFTLRPDLRPSDDTFWAE
jgi:hypothetical protein